MTRHFRISVFLFLLFSGLLGNSLAAMDAAVLTAPKRLFAGSESSFTITTFDSTTRVSVNRTVLVQLVNSENVVVSTLFSGATGPEGRVTTRFSIPSDLAGTFKIIASVQGLKESLQLTAQVDRSPALLIETDKPIYKPGQTIMGRVVLLNAALQPQSGEVEIALHDAKGIRVGKFQSEVDEYGIAAFQLPLASELNHGTWKIRAESGSSRSVRDIRVEPYTLPRFELITSFPKSWVLVDEAISGTIEATYFFGKPVSGTVQISAKRWIGVWEEYSTVEEDLTEGSLDFSLPAVGYVAGTLDRKGQGTVLLEIEVTDSVGNTQKTIETLTISSAPAVLSLIPTTESFKPGMPATVFLQSTQPDGVPVDLNAGIEIRYLASDQTTIATEDRALETSVGFAEFDFTAPERTQYVEIKAEAEYGGYSATTSRRIGGAYSPSGSFISLVRLGEDSLTVGQVARFSVQSSTSGTVYYEVFAGGRTILSDATESDSFDLTVTTEMVPRANVVAYMISPFSEIAADRVSIPVALPITLTIDADFNLAQVRPGDPVEVEIDTGTGRKTMLGVSIVDESVLALGNGRLHLAEVFDELEERFLEPQIEIHDGGGGPEPGPFFPGFMPPVSTTGSRDVFNETGLGIVASPGINIPQGSGVFDDGPVAVNPAEGGGKADQTAPDVPRVREFFPETWVWNPMLLTDDEGKARLTLIAPDSITGWKLAVVSTCPKDSSNQPGIGFGEGELTVFQDFFVEPVIPYSVIRGEEFSLRVDVFNYLDEDQVVELSLADTEGIEFTDSKSLSLTVPANSAMPASFTVNPVEVGEFPVTITAIGSSSSDAVKRPITVIPEGLPAEQILNDVIEPGQVHQLNLQPPPRMVEDSSRTFLYISPSPVAQSMNGVSDLLGMPYGCGEQNMIFLAPDIEILKYLREIGELAPEVRAEAENFINVGYQRQLTFQSDDGGFAAFGGEQGSLWLTAFVLSTFSNAREVRDIDESVLTASAEMLVSRQKTDGSFKTDDFRTHKEIDGGLENLYAMTAYVAKALADHGSDDFSDELQKAAGYLASRTTDIWEDAYSLAIAAVAVQKIKGYSDLAEALLDRLMELAISEGTGIHWEPYPVETTGYAASALLSSGETGRPESQSAIDWLSTQRNSLGGYGSSTQDTVVALHALFQAARNANRDLAVDLGLWSGSELLYAVHLDQTNYDVLQQFEVPKDRTAFELRSVGVGTVAYQWVERFNLPGEFLPPSKNLIFEVEYSTDHVEIDDIVDVRAVVRYSGWKEKTGMVILDIGVPTGFEPVQTSLDKLQESETVSRVEVAGRKIILYMDELISGEEYVLELQIRATMPVSGKSTISKAYEYYDPDVVAYDQQSGVKVLGPPPTLQSVSTETAIPGHEIVLTGSGFSQGPVSVFFNGIEVTGVRVLNDGTLVVLVPRLPSGEATIRIVTAAGSVTYSGSGDLVIGPTTFYIPLNKQGYTGLSLINYSDQAAGLQVQTLGSSESRSAEVFTSPILLSPGEQLLRLAAEVFEESLLDESSWLIISSDTPRVAGCFQHGHSTQLDGSSSLIEPLSEFIFSRVHSGSQSFNGEQASTFISIGNPNSEPVNVTATLYRTDENGQSLQKSISIPGSHSIEASIEDWFGIEVKEGYLRIMVEDGRKVVATLKITIDNRTLLGVPLIHEGPGNAGSLPLVLESPVFTTRLRMLNPESKTHTIQLKFSPTDSSRDPIRKSFRLGPGEVLEESLNELLNAAVGTQLEGSLKLISSGDTIYVDTLWTNRIGASFGTASAAIRSSSKKTLLPYLIKSAEFFTGLAFFNPLSESTEVSIKLYSSDGVLSGSAELDLDAGEAVSRLFRELFPDLADETMGYAIVESARPIVIQELVGDMELNYLSSISPNPLE